MPMTKEQEEAIKNLLEILKLSKNEIKNGNINITAILDYEDLKSLQIALNMLKEKDAEVEEYKKMIAAGIINTVKDELMQERNKEIEKKDKIIDLMADYMLSGLDDTAFNNICKQGHCVHELKDNRLTKCRKCKDCIKQYFERKVKNGQRKNRRRIK